MRLNAPTRLLPTLRAFRHEVYSSYNFPSTSPSPSGNNCSYNNSVGIPRPYTRVFPTNRHPLFSPKPDPADILDPSRPHRARHRLGLFASHLANTQKPVLELNTPFSVERTSSSQDHAAIIADESRKILEAQTIKTLKELDKQEKEQIVEEEQEKEQEQKQSPRMSTQEPHAALLIPGPIEFDDAVLQSMSHFSESHVGMPFVKIFGESLSLLRKLFQTSNPASQPFIIAGSGTLGWDQIASNLTEPGDDVLVLHTGYFADSFAECFEAYGANATQLKAPIGDRPQQDEVEKALKEKKYKIITITHVDTSTGVLSEIKSISELVHRVSPETLVIVDGVCSAGSEEIRFDDWGLDVVMTASQKGIGCPAGLSILMASERAIQTFKARTHRATSYFASWKNWMPIMQNYEAQKPSYFATPPPQLVRALHTSLTQILSVPLEDRFAAHRAVSQKVKKAVGELGLQQLASKPENQANGMTAIYLPDNLTPPQVLPNLMKKGVIFAGGLHKEIASKYIRFGHMGVSVTDSKRDDIDRAIAALKDSLVEVGYKVPK